MNVEQGNGNPEPIEARGFTTPLGGLAELDLDSVGATFPAEPAVHVLGQVDDLTRGPRWIFGTPDYDKGKWLPP